MWIRVDAKGRRKEGERPERKRALEKRQRARETEREGGGGVLRDGKDKIEEEGSWWRVVVVGADLGKV